ncbi:MAG: segregation/condensation protein A, partial [Nocardioides sp.]|nr:segregation/condensation protein A [Nocardioides sp.]
DQVDPLGELGVRWTGDEDTDVEDLVTDEFDGAPPEPGADPEPDPQPDPATTQEQP